jgi:CheY-like chemotaxis protein
MNKSVLIIDDELDICEVIQAALEEFAGWQVLSANSGREGLELLERVAVDVVLLDISMPEMDGLEVFQRLRSQACTATIPVILLTAKVLPSDKKRFAQMGVVGVVSKPFNPLHLWQEIARLMGW